MRPKAHAPIASPIDTMNIPFPPVFLTLFHHNCTVGINADVTATSMRADAKPAAKLLTLGFSDGRYRKPEPEECGGMMKMSYFPGGSPDDLGASPWGGGGGGFIACRTWCVPEGTEDCVQQGLGVGPDCGENLRQEPNFFFAARGISGSLYTSSNRYNCCLGFVSVQLPGSPYFICQQTMSKG